MPTGSNTQDKCYTGALIVLRHRRSQNLLMDSGGGVHMHPLQPLLATLRLTTKSQHFAVRMLKELRSLTASVLTLYGTKR